MRALALLALVGGTAAAAAIAARVYTDLLWFDEVGHADVLWTTLRWKLVADVLFPVATACLVLANMAVIDRVLVAHSRTAAVHPRIERLWPYRRLIYPAYAIACAVVTSHSVPTPTWQQLALWANRQDFGVTDPLFHRDVGFYVFSLPVYQGLARWALVVLVLLGGTSIAVYAAAGAIQVGWPPAISQAAREHLLTVAALGFLVVAWRFRLDAYALALPHDDSPVSGASYTDAHVRIPALHAFAYTCVLGAGVCMVAVISRVPRRAVIALVVCAGLLGLASESAPRVVDRYEVAPQELTKERPYLAWSIESTRRAFALDRVDVRSVNDGPLTPSDVAAERDTLSNISLWDPQVLRAAMNELETIGRYYSFPSTTVDSYMVGGHPQLMTVAPRELDVKNLEPSAYGWATSRFAYTHGYGVVAARAGQADAQRYPQFAQKNFGGGNPLGLREPRIYFGERTGGTAPWIAVNTNRAEVEQPKPGSDPPDYHYGGSAGVRLGGPLRRAAFALRFSDVKLLLTETLRGDSRIIMHRNVRERIKAVAPFLQWEGRPHAAVIEGRIQYVFDGYTSTNRYPYSEPIDFRGKPANYVRATAIGVVDSYSGATTFYAIDTADPIMRAWRATYPGLFRDPTAMPATLRAHLRYPRRLFQAQVEAYGKYHATDVTSFWNGSDRWQRPFRIAGPVDKAGELRFPDPLRSVETDERTERRIAPERMQLQPDYVIARLPGQKVPEFTAVMPFTPRGRHNMVGYLAGTVDDLGRPRLALLSLPRDRLAVGPAQATRRILGSPGVNRRVELLNRESRDLGRSAINRTVLGTPRVVPVGDSLVHVQSIYVTSSGSSLPRLQLVTVQANGRIGYGRDLDAALRRVLPRETATAPRGTPASAAPAAGVVPDAARPR